MLPRQVMATLQGLPLHDSLPGWQGVPYFCASFTRTYRCKLIANGIRGLRSFWLERNRPQGRQIFANRAMGPLPRVGGLAGSVSAGFRGCPLADGSPDVLATLRPVEGGGTAGGAIR